MMTFSCAKVVMRLDRLETDVTFVPIVAINQMKGTVINVSYSIGTMWEEGKIENRNTLDFKEVAARN